MDEIVFSRGELPFDVECQECQVVRTLKDTFLPASALLAALYGTCRVSRSVFQLLRELAEAAPLRDRAHKSICGTGLLVPEAEAQGFRLNSIFSDPAEILAEVTWEPSAESCRFHVCLAKFRKNNAGHLDNGIWMEHRDIGVSQVLAGELQRQVPGEPAGLMSDAGRQLMRGKIGR